MSTWKYSDFERHFDGFRSFKTNPDGLTNALVPATVPSQDEVPQSPVYEQVDHGSPANDPRVAAVHLDASPTFTACTILLLIAVTVLAIQYRPALEQLTSEVAEGVAAATYLIKSVADCLAGLKALGEGIAGHTADVWCMIFGGSTCIYRYKASTEYARWLGNQQSMWQSAAPQIPPRFGKPTPLPKTKELVDGIKRLGELTTDLDTERHISDALFRVSKPMQNLRPPDWTRGLEEFLPSLSAVKNSRDRTRSQISNTLQSLSYQYAFLSQQFGQPVSRFKAKLFQSVRERQDLYPTVLVVARETSVNVETAIQHANDCVRRSQQLRGQSLALLSAIRDWMQSLRQISPSRGVWCQVFGGSLCLLQTEAKEVVASLNELVIAIGPTVTVVDHIGRQCDQLGGDLVSWVAAFNFTLGMGTDGAVSWQFAKPKVILDTLRDTVALVD